MAQPTDEEMRIIEMILRLPPEEKQDALVYLEAKADRKLGAPVKTRMAEPDVSYVAPKDD